ncbi:MAG: hypothetical protein A2583_16270 [Bdellovibrionales bacterium RIFOXYD1_FULL_53_11]|nr:MAG: hypothetical protein A2583_16270 [Bdellovibrionales bacterium RIFOXYD1_FULL_53_11]
MSQDIDRKTLKKPDEFTTKVKSLFDLMADHSRKILFLLGIVFVAAFVFALLSSRSNTRNEEAKGSLFQAKQALDKELAVIASAEAPAMQKKSAQPSPELVAFKHFDVNAKLAGSVGKLKTVIKQYEGTKAALDARMTLGDLYFNHGQYAASIEWYQQAADKASGTSDRAMALLGWGYALENSKQINNAIAVYERALNTGDGMIKGDSMLSLARCFELANDKNRAKLMYERIISQLPDSPHQRTAEDLKSRIE